MIFFSGCAYNWGSTERVMPGGYKLVAVPTFRNQSHDVGAEVFFSNALIQEIERSKTARVTDRDSATIVVEGTVQDIKAIAGSQVKYVENEVKSFPIPSSGVLNTQYQVVVSVGLVVRRLSDKKILWDGTLKGERTYLAPKVGTEYLNSVNALYNQKARYQTVEVVAGELMSEALDRMTENF
jgi:hypothetical protein